jgi:membrane-bound lytic murein transglycosylase B
MKINHAILLLLLCFASHPAHAATLPGIPEFIDEMVVKHKFKRAELERIFDNAQHLPSVIEAISRPATLKPWLEYRASFVNPERINKGLKFWKKYRHTLRNAERKYGVPQEIILAVIGVETVYGQDMGTFRTMDALTTLAFDYPRRADFFRSELENYLLLAREQQFNMLAVRGSYAGALGIPQFMPSSYRTYAVDFNGNHKIDLLHEDRDAIGSVASYLKAYGWVSGVSEKLVHVKDAELIPPVAVRVRVSEEACPGDVVTPRTVAAWAEAGIVPDEKIADTRNEPARLIDFTVAEGKEFWLAFNNFDVITRYNNSDFYAMSVFQLAEAVKAARKSSATKKSSAVIKSGDANKHGAENISGPEAKSGQAK